MAASRRENARVASRFTTEARSSKGDMSEKEYVSILNYLQDLKQDAS